MPNINLKTNQVDKIILSLSFIKATAWVILGISSMFTVYDLTSSQSDGFWLSSFIKFGLAVAFLFSGIFFQKNPKRNVFLIMLVILVDVFVSIQSPIGIFDFLMLLFDLIYYWIILSFLKQVRQ